MKVGVPTEIKTDEYRVALTPAGVRELVEHGHEVFIQAGAGEGSAISDAEYTSQGAKILPDAAAVFAEVDMIVKVKEPQAVEVAMLEPRHTLFTYLHLAPYVIRREQLGLMKNGAVLVDVSIDQGGCFETSRATTHSDPTYEVDGVLHYCVANMPGAVPVTSTRALTNATMPYIVHVADSGAAQAARENPGLAKGVNVVGGKVTYAPVAEATGLTYHDALEALA